MKSEGNEGNGDEDARKGGGATALDELMKVFGVCQARAERVCSRSPSFCP